jgi:hypothetical protein
MIHDKDFVPRPDGQVERLPRKRAGRTGASYAPALPRLGRRLPSAPTDRRSKPRLDIDACRGWLIDLDR